jgi:hypothetical protein
MSPLRVLLRTVGESDDSLQFELREDQLAMVGRDAPAKFVVPGDMQLSRVHFSLQCTAQYCMLRDLKSANGTLVNGKRVTQTLLVNGDSIQAGATYFDVAIEVAPVAPGCPPAAVLPARTIFARTLRDRPSATMAGARPTAQVAAPRPVRLSQVRPVCTQTSCNSGLVCFEAGAPRPKPLDVMGILATQWPVTLLIDVGRLRAGPGNDLLEAEYLFDWLEPEARRMASPVVIRPPTTGSLGDILERAWGLDCLVCIFSELETSVLLAHLRRMARHTTPRRGQAPAESVVGWSWPSILSMLLAHATTQRAEEMLEGIEAILVEGPRPIYWRLFMRPPAAARLPSLGFVCQDKAPAAGPTAA